MGVWWLLRFDNPELFQVDSALNPSLKAAGAAGATLTEGIAVTQNKQSDPHYWVMVTTFGAQVLVDTNVAAEIAFGSDSTNGTPTTTLYVNTDWITDPNGIVVPGFFGPGLPPPKPNQPGMNAIPAQPTYQLLSGLNIAQPTNIIHIVWYLFGFPNPQYAAPDLPVIFNEAFNAGGSAQPVDVYASTHQNSVQAQPGTWILLRVPTIVDSAGGLLVSPRLITDNYLKLVWDFTTNQLVITRLGITDHIQIQDSTGTVILDGIPIPGLSPINLPGPPVAPPNPITTYRANAIIFSGQAGIVSTTVIKPIENTSFISFAGWFKVNWQIGGTPLEFSQGNPNNTIVIDEDTANLTPNTWTHLMGTLNGLTQDAVLLVNGISQGTTKIVGSSFTGVTTEGVPITIGTDGFGNFFTGSIADLSIWVDTDWTSATNFIPRSIINSFIDPNTHLPVNPFIAFSNLIALPDVFVCGPVSDMFSYPVVISPGVSAVGRVGIEQPGISQLRRLTGLITDDSTSPSDPRT